jgi:Xaa-Pro aminopeptidase
MPFEQSRDIFYLSGVDQEESILLPDAPYEHQEIISKRNKRPYSRLGEKLTKERALAVTGIKTVWLQDFEKVLFEMMTHAETIYINTNEHYSSGRN